MRPVDAWRDSRISGGRESRRVTPRIEVEALLNGRLAEGSRPMIVRDLGFGGFCLESACAFAVGSCHDFSFAGPGGLALVIRAEAVYSQVVSPSEGTDRVLSGFKYVLGTAEAERVVDVLVAAALSPISFE
jgi:hypothetical protein